MSDIAVIFKFSLIIHQEMFGCRWRESSCRFVVSSDIVFIRTWYPVTVPNFYNPVTSLLLPPDQKETWQGMRSVGQLRRDLGMKAPFNSDSLYKVDSISLAISVWVLQTSLSKNLLIADRSTWPLALLTGLPFHSKSILK